MHTELVEIYSDTSNAAVMRHPGRKFPGLLVQGDTMRNFCVEADAACESARGVLDEEGFERIDSLRNDLWLLLDHYKRVLGEHGIPLPFSEAPVR